MVTRYRFTGTITNVFEKTEQRHVSGAGKEAEFKEVKAGWFATINHIHSYYLGMERPVMEIGEDIVIIIERPAKPLQPANPPDVPLPPAPTTLLIKEDQI